MSTKLRSVVVVGVVLFLVLLVQLVLPTIGKPSARALLESEPSNQREPPLYTQENVEVDIIERDAERINEYVTVTSMSQVDENPPEAYDWLEATSYMREIVEHISPVSMVHKADDAKEISVEEKAYEQLWDRTAANLRHLAPGLSIPVDTCPGHLPCLKGDVVLLHQGRCGSTALMSSLGSNGFGKPTGYPWAYHQSLEPFNGHDWSPLEGESDLERMEDAFQQISSRLDAYREPEKPLIMSLKIQHIYECGLSPTDFLTTLAAYGVRHLIVIYRNPLRVQVSYQGARIRRESGEGATDIFHTAENENINCANMTFARHMLNVDRVERAYVDALQHPAFHNPIVLAYERDLHRDTNVGAARVLQGLGQQLPVTQTKLLTTTDCPLQEMLDNYEELEKLLRGTAYEFALEPDGEQVPLDRPEILLRMCETNVTDYRPEYIECDGWTPFQLPRPRRHHRQERRKPPRRDRDND